MSDPAAERAFQDEIIAHLTARGWLLGSSDQYDRQRALYPEDVVGYVKDTQPEAWEKFSKLHPQATEEALLALVARQLERVDPNATSKDMRKYGTLGALRHPLKDRGVTLRLCQFKPDHSLNPETLAAYGANRLRVVPEVRYSPHAKYPAKGEAQGASSKDWRIDLVLFVNGIPVATLELKSEFKQPHQRDCANRRGARSDNRNPWQAVGGSNGRGCRNNRRNYRATDRAIELAIRRNLTHFDGISPPPKTSVFTPQMFDD